MISLLNIAMPGTYYTMQSGFGSCESSTCKRRRSRLISGLLILFTITGIQTVSAQPGNIAGEQPAESLELLKFEQDQIEGDTIFSEARVRAHARALGRQMESPNFSAIISAEQLDRFTDYTVGEGLGRVSGVHMSRRGELNLRGTGLNRYQVTVDGQRMGSTGLGDRSVDLGGIPVDMIQELEIMKVVTPDMDADALAGTVNLVTRHQPDITGRELTIRAGGGSNTHYMDYTSPGTRVSASYVDAPIDGLTISANLSYLRNNNGWESLGIGYGVADFGNGPMDVIESVSPGYHMNEQNRVGGRAQLSYQATESTTFNLQGMLNSNNREFVRHRNILETNGTWVRPDTTDGQGLYTYNMNLQENNIRQYSVQAGGEHLLDRFNIDYNVGWSYGGNHQQQDEVPFQRDNISYSIDWDNPDRPFLLPTNFPTLIGGEINPRGLNMEYHDRIFDDHSDSRISGNLNVEIPAGPVLFKVGSSALLINKDGDYSNSRFSHPRRPTLYAFNEVRHGGIKVFDEKNYDIPIFVDPYGVRAFYHGNRPTLTYDINRRDRLSEIWNYSVSENIYAGYGMGTIDLGPLTLMGGLRMEYTDAKYEGRKARFNERGEMRESADTSQTADHIHLFPNAQIWYSPAERTNIRAAYSRTIGRPDFNLLAPFESYNIQDSTLTRGNPEITPIVSENLDVLLEHYIGNVGTFSVGLYYKQLTDFVYQSQQTIESGELEGFREVTYKNGEETATVYGVELSWQQYLTFLPGFLRNLSAYANYTWSDSDFDVDFRNDDVRLPYQSPHVINAALDYTQGRFSTQVSYHWTSDALIEIRDAQETAPSISQNEMVYMDRYQDGWSDLSVSFRFRISSNFRFWADASNLLGSERQMYRHTRDLYPVSTDIRGGQTFQLGIRFDL